VTWGDFNTLKSWKLKAKSCKLSFKPGWRLPAGRQGTGRRMLFVYALQSQQKNFIYVGMTDNIERRLKEHNSGNVRSTKFYRPLKVIYTEPHRTRIEARSREKYLKSGIGKEFLKSL
jgi:putative endonuclease